MPERLRKFEVGELNADQRALYEAIAGGPRAQGPQAFKLTDEAGRLEGPFNAMLLRPALGEALQALGAAVRYQGRLSDREREIAILTVAALQDCAFERYAHEALGRVIGLGDEEIKGLRAGAYEVFTDDRERLVAVTAHALTLHGDLTDEEFARAREGLGEAGIFELTTLAGYYRTLALQLRVFRVPLPE